MILRECAVRDARAALLPAKRVLDFGHARLLGRSHSRFRMPRGHLGAAHGGKLRGVGWTDGPILRQRDHTRQESQAGRDAREDRREVPRVLAPLVDRRAAEGEGRGQQDRERLLSHSVIRPFRSSVLPSRDDVCEWPILRSNLCSIPENSSARGDNLDGLSAMACRPRHDL